jgi:hypothetical protein
MTKFDEAAADPKWRALFGERAHFKGVEILLDCGNTSWRNAGRKLRRQGAPLYHRVGATANHDVFCPAHEASQITLVNQTRSTFRPYLAQKRVLAILCYARLDPREGFAIYSVRSFDRDGRLALASF